jgi:hypothetical protein
MASSDLIFALEASKYAARQTLGVRRVLPDQEELLKLLNKQMLFQVLSDSSCLEELTADEVTELEGILILHS